MVGMDAAGLSALNSLVGHFSAIDVLVLFFATYALYLFIPIFLLIRFSARLRVLLVCAVAMCGVYATNAFIGLFWYRERPFLQEHVNQLIHVLMPTKSFPSDHSALAFAAATVLFLFSAKRWSWSLFVLAALIAIARIAGGVHYPSDAIAGAVLGTGWGIGVYFLNKHVK